MSHARELVPEDSGLAPLPLPATPAQARARERWTLDYEQSLSDAILEAAQDGVLCLDSEGRIAFANPAAARVMGVAADELRDQPVVTHFQFSSFGLDANLRLLPRGESVCWREDGSSFPVEYESAPLDPGTGLVGGTVITFRDISRRRAIEQTNKERIATVTHELRTPLTSIRSSLGLLAGGVLDAQPQTGQRMLQIAVSNVDRLIRLVNDVLDLERLDSGQIRLRRVVCDVPHLLRQAADGVQSLAHDAGVEIDVQSAPAWLVGDPDRLLQVVTNLLSNAIKFSPAGSATVWVEAEQSDDEVLIRVRDEGRGIPAAMLESIFERFRQVEDGDARERGGTGLGLAICRSIVLQHAGQIWAESTVGAGTTICVALPAADDAAFPFEAEDAARA